MSDDRKEIPAPALEMGAAQQEAAEVESKVPLKDYSSEIKYAPASRDTDQIVEEWFDNHIRGSIVGQHTTIWNHIMVCKDHLKKALRERL